MSENELSSIIIGAAIEVHTELGPGLLESIYESCLYYELKQIGLKVERQVEVPLTYKDLFFETGLRLDLIVQDKVMLINFNEVRLKHGLQRVVNNL